MDFYQYFRAQNYLRVRGEYRHIKGEDLSNEELPPRARRILFENYIVELLRGTTSACAENTDQGLEVDCG